MPIMFLPAKLLGDRESTENGDVHDTSTGVTTMETATSADLKECVKSSGKVHLKFHTFFVICTN